MEERLRMLRKESKKTQTEIAEYLGMQQGSYQKYENGIAEPSIEKLKALADYYHVTIDYLVGRDFANDIGFLTDDEKNLLSVYKKLNPVNKMKITAEIIGMEMGQG